MLSKEFYNLQCYLELKILSININIFYDFNKAKCDCYQ